MANDLQNLLRSLVRRDGLATAGKALRYAFSPKAWRWLRKQARERRLAEESGVVDRDWYRREYPEVAEKGIDPVQDFLDPEHVSTRIPNPDFDPREYAAIHFDVKASGYPPALHWMLLGRRESRSVSMLETAAAPFPDGAVELRREFAAAPPVRRRTAVFASFSGDGRIKDTVLYYLRGLREVVDNIVFVANSPVFPDEAGKLDGLVRLAVFRNHGCYDFGSYRIGLNEAGALGLLAPDVCDELVVCNDSCYGPVFPFPEVFGEMERRRSGRRIDFWGMSLTRHYGRLFIPSYFYVFGPAVLEGGELYRWFDRLEPCRDRGQVVVNCETRLTEHLLRAGYSCDGLVPESFHRTRSADAIKFPLTTMREFRDPLVKIKALRGDSLESIGDAVAFVRDANPELAALLPPCGAGKGKSGSEVAREARKRHADAMEDAAASLRRRTAAGAPARVLFLCLSPDGFPAMPAFREAFRDARLRCSAVAAPDLRTSSVSVRNADMRATRAAILRTAPEDAVPVAVPDSAGNRPDFASDFDVVCWETAENASDFRYNPHWSVGRRFLPVLFFDRRKAGPYPLEKEFGRQNYAYFRMVFFADRETFDLYAAHSLRGADNAVLAEDGDFLRALAEGLGFRRSGENRSETECVP